MQNTPKPKRLTRPTLRRRPSTTKATPTPAPQPTQATPAPAPTTPNPNPAPRVRIVFDATPEYRTALKVLSANLDIPIYQIMFNALEKTYGLKPPQ